MLNETWRLWQALERSRFELGTFATGATAAGTLVGSTTVDALGNWVLDFTLAGTNDPRNPTSTLFSVRPTRIYATSTLGGRSTDFPIAIK